ncbi:hypothetical protein [Paraburkholderia heleia]|uniref:hypothetical protein n=1 Tax=Paraburkholderia heleia TaxID=634127 RepID=UPI002AB664CE|nr:hypothetical protein [Paraburkholderia heleia]
MTVGVGATVLLALCAAHLYAAPHQAQAARQDTPSVAASVPASLPSFPPLPPLPMAMADSGAPGTAGAGAPSAIPLPAGAASNGTPNGPRELTVVARRAAKAGELSEELIQSFMDALGRNDTALASTILGRVSDLDAQDNLGYLRLKTMLCAATADRGCEKRTLDRLVWFLPDDLDLRAQRAALDHPVLPPSKDAGNAWELP